MNLTGAETDSAGVAEFAAPAGSIEIRASTSGTAPLRLTGSATLTVALGAVAAAEMTLAPPDP